LRAESGDLKLEFGNLRTLSEAGGVSVASRIVPARLDFPSFTTDNDFIHNKKITSSKLYK